MTGYLAFPPGSPPFRFQYVQPLVPDPEELKRQAELETQQRIKAEAWEARCRRDAEIRRKRLERQEAAARLGELDWVRSGGLIRDDHGYVDMARTEMYRAEIRIIDEEKRLIDPWNAYEKSWRIVTTSDRPIKWSDIPWPVHKHPTTVDELTPDAIAEFIFSPLKVRAATGTRKEKIRASLLRWHPDKLSSVLARVINEEKELVREGVNTVCIALRKLQDDDARL
ncbi:hypothetical protein C8Q75DRAFT_447457 [Abortiporus biennis]|nr:hypothetical protein C8Q75DRAFT_447457 [Abortiporus biennis]